MTQAIAQSFGTATSQERGHRIRRLQFIGGLFDGAVFEFSDDLSCLIGERGVGKSTVIETIRFALDDYAGCSKELREHSQGLAADNLAGGRVVLSVVTDEGLEYAISRSAGEAPVILTPDGRSTEIKLQGNQLIRANIFSQDQMENIASDRISQLALIDTFDPQGIGTITSQIAPLQNALEVNAAELFDLRQKAQDLRQDVQTLPVVTEQLKSLSGGKGKQSQAVNAGYEEKAARDREKIVITLASQTLDELHRQLSEQIGQLSERAQATLALELHGPNSAILKQVLQTLLDCGKAVDKNLDTILTAIEQHQKQLGEVKLKLDTEHDRQELAFRKMVEKDRKAQARSAERGPGRRDITTCCLRRDGWISCRLRSTSCSNTGNHSWKRSGNCGLSASSFDQLSFSE